MFWKVLPVAFEESFRVVLYQVDFTADLFGFVGLEAAEAEVRVEAAGDALEEFLVGFPSGGEEEFFVAAEAADESVAGNERAEWARVDVGAGDVLGAPDLAGDVAGFGGPLRGGHAGEFAIDEDEALGDVVFEVALAEVGAVFRSGEFAEAHARLGPVGFGDFGGGIVGGEFEGDLVGSGSDGVIDDDAVGEGVAELHRFAVIAERDEFALVFDDSVLDPIGIGGVGAAIGLKVVDAEFAAGEMFALDDEPMAIALEGEAGIFLRRSLGEEEGRTEKGEERKEESHSMFLKNRGVEGEAALIAGWLRGSRRHCSREGAWCR